MAPHTKDSSGPGGRLMSVMFGGKRGDRLEQVTQGLLEFNIGLNIFSEYLASSAVLASVDQAVIVPSMHIRMLSRSL